MDERQFICSIAFDVKCIATGMLYSRIERPLTYAPAFLMSTPIGLICHLAEIADVF